MLNKMEGNVWHQDWELGQSHSAVATRRRGHLAAGIAQR